MGKMIEKIIAQIEEQAVLRGIAPSTLCFHAVNDGKLLTRLRSGGTINLRTVERLDAYFATPIPVAETASAEQASA